jgi:hypothetical protein
MSGPSRALRFVVVIGVIGFGLLGWSAREANAALAVDMAAIDFGDVTMNMASSPITLTVTNDDTMNTVAVVFSQSAGCGGRLSFTPTGGTVPVRNAPNDGQLTVQVRFTPNSRNALASCTITVDQPSGTDPTVTVAGDSDAPRLVVSGGGLTFGNLRWNASGAGASATRTLTIDNTGDAVMNLANVTTALSGTHAADFSIVAGAETGFPITIGGSGTIDVQFNPSANGARTATLNIELNNDPTGETVADVPASGTGIQSIQTFDRASPYNLGAAPLGGGTIDASACRRARRRAQRRSPSTPPRRSRSAAATTRRCSADASSGMPSTTKTLTLNCTGVPPTLTVSPTSVTFAGNTRVGSAATVQTITISNATGAQALTYSAATSSMAEFPLSCMGGGTACVSGPSPRAAARRSRSASYPAR